MAFHKAGSSSVSLLPSCSSHNVDECMVVVGMSWLQFSRSLRLVVVVGRLARVEGKEKNKGNKVVFRSNWHPFFSFSLPICPFLLCHL